MARNNWTLVTPSAVALVGGVAKTVLQVVAPNAAVVEVIQDLVITFDGILVSAVPTVVQVLRKTGVATVTAQTRKKTKDKSTALLTDSAGTGYDASAEGTDGDVLATFHVHPQAGIIYSVPLPDGEIELPGSGIVAVKVNAPAGVNCLVTLKGEE